jgi:O-antigen/teichoic acid export membrane protein
MNLKKRVAQNTIIQIIGKAVSTLLGVAALALMTRYLGTNGFGQYSTIITFVSFFAMSADLGLTLVSAQMISDPQEDQDKTLSNLFSLRLVSALIILSLAPISVLLFPYDSVIVIGVLIATISYIFPALNQILIALFQKTLKMKQAMIAEVSSKIILLIGIFLSIQLNGGLNGILWASVLGAFSNFALSWILGKREAKIKLAFDKKVWKKIIKKSWPLALTIILNLLYQKGDLIILSLFQGIEEVGIYGASYRTIEVIGTIPYMFAGIMLPLFTTNWLQKNFDFFKKISQKSFDLMIILALPLAIGTQFVAKEIISLIAGAEFSESGLALQFLITSTALLFISSIFSHLIIAIDKQKKLIGLYIFTSLSSLLLYFILIPKFSYRSKSLGTKIWHFIRIL